MVRMVFLPSGVWGVTVKQFEPSSTYRASLFNPVDGNLQDIGGVKADPLGNWTPPPPRAPVFQDWVLVLDAT